MCFSIDQAGQAFSSVESVNGRIAIATTTMIPDFTQAAFHGSGICSRQRAHTLSTERGIETRTTNHANACCLSTRTSCRKSRRSRRNHRQRDRSTKGFPSIRLVWPSTISIRKRLKFVSRGMFSNHKSSRPSTLHIPQSPRQAFQGQPHKNPAASNQHSTAMNAMASIIPLAGQMPTRHSRASHRRT